MIPQYILSLVILLTFGMLVRIFYIERIQLQKEAEFYAEKYQSLLKEYNKCQSALNDMSEIAKAIQEENRELENTIYKLELKK